MTGSSDKKQEYGSALNKALAVLEMITSQPQAIGLPDLATRLQMPRQTAHRILRQLEEQNLIIRDPTRDRFIVGPRLSRLATAALFSENHNLPTRAILRQLVADIGESCNIGVLDGLHFMYLDRIQAENSLRVHLDVGSRVPAHCTSGGKMLLACLSPGTSHDLLRANPLSRYTGQTLTEPGELAANLAMAREAGYARNDEEFTAGIVGVAVPIYNQAGEAIAAVACHAPSARRSLAELERCVPQLRAAADSLSQYWG